MVWLEVAPYAGRVRLVDLSDKRNVRTNLLTPTEARSLILDLQRAVEEVEPDPFGRQDGGGNSG